MNKDEVRSKIESEGIRNIILNALPQNATNGDVFLKIFTQAEASVNDSLGERGTVFVYLGEDIIMIPLDIWNAPYKESEE